MSAYFDQQDLKVTSESNFDTTMTPCVHAHASLRFLGAASYYSSVKESESDDWKEKCGTAVEALNLFMGINETGNYGLPELIKFGW